MKLQTAEMAAKRLEDFAESPWGERAACHRPELAARRLWEQVIPFFAYREGDPQNHLYDQCHREPAYELRNVLKIKTKGHFPGD